MVFDEDLSHINPAPKVREGFCFRGEHSHNHESAKKTEFFTFIEIKNKLPFCALKTYCIRHGVLIWCLSQSIVL